MSSKMLGSVFVVIVFAGAVRGLRWSDQLMSETGSVEVCSGHDIQLLWNFTLDPMERLKGMVWDCQPEGKKEEILATYVDGNFVPTSTYSGRLAHLEEGSIELSCATILESGNYSIAVSTENAFNQMTTYRKTVNVRVVDQPKTLSGELHVTQDEEAVLDPTTGTWHVQLSCGNFSDRGHPPIDVIWKTPDGSQLDSTGFQDGMFHFLVPNPVVDGNYTCTVPPSQTAIRCLAKDTPLLDTASVHVQQTTARFVLLEARQQELMDKITAENQRLHDVFDSMSNRTNQLEERLDQSLQDSAPVNFHARLKEDIYLEEGNILRLSNIISNQGHGYDANSGYFTAPVSGTYFFIGTTGSYTSGGYANMYLMNEGNVVARTYIYMYSSYYSMGSAHATLSLTAGDQVWLESSEASYFYWRVTSFSGFRI